MAFQTTTPIRHGWLNYDHGPWFSGYLGRIGVEFTTPTPINTLEILLIRGQPAVTVSLYAGAFVEGGVPDLIHTVILSTSQEQWRVVSFATQPAGTYYYLMSLVTQDGTYINVGNSSVATFSSVPAKGLTTNPSTGGITTGTYAAATVFALMPTLKPPKRWNGAAWVDATAKRWTGSAWVDAKMNPNH